MAGIIQEQNPDRCRLFMQWRRMEWPILVDTFDLLEVSVVPLTYAIDEHGIVRFAGLRLDDASTLEARFVDRDWPAPADAESSRTEEAASDEDPDWRRLAGRAATGDAAAIEEAIAVFRRQILRDPRDGWAHFRLAASHRLRHDSGARRSGDFQRAVDHWQIALGIDPNNYIWRRRIQQYGPRLDKPYPFYDWVETARREIRARGETPVALVAEPSGAEIARPLRRAPDARPDGAEPDAMGRITRDGIDANGAQGPPFVDIEVTTIPRRVVAGGTARAHLDFRPNGDRKAHWNNESAPLTLWVAPPEGWRVEGRRHVTPNAESATSDESRRIEVEIGVPENAPAGPVSTPAYALYYVCEDTDGVCLYRRQDLEIALTIVD